MSHPPTDTAHLARLNPSPGVPDSGESIHFRGYRTALRRARAAAATGTHRGNGRRRRRSRACPTPIRRDRGVRLGYPIAGHRQRLTCSIDWSYAHASQVRRFIYGWRLRFRAVLANASIESRGTHGSVASSREDAGVGTDRLSRTVRRCAVTVLNRRRRGAPHRGTRQPQPLAGLSDSLSRICPASALCRQHHSGPLPDALHVPTRPRNSNGRAHNGIRSRCRNQPTTYEGVRSNESAKPAT